MKVLRTRTDVHPIRNLDLDNQQSNRFRTPNAAEPMANEFISKIGFIGFFVMAGFAGTIYFGSLLSPIIHPEKARTNYKVVPFDEAIRKYHGQPPRNFKLPKMPKTPEWRHFEFQ